MLNFGYLTPLICESGGRCLVLGREDVFCTDQPREK